MVSGEAERGKRGSKEGWKGGVAKRGSQAGYQSRVKQGREKV